MTTTFYGTTGKDTYLIKNSADNRRFVEIPMTPQDQLRQAHKDAMDNVEGLLEDLVEKATKGLAEVRAAKERGKLVGFSISDGGLCEGVVDPIFKKATKLLKQAEAAFTTGLLSV